MKHKSSCKEAGWLTGITYDGKSLRTISERVPYPYIRVERTLFGNKWVLRINPADEINEKKVLAEKKKLALYTSLVLVLITILALVLAALFGGLTWKNHTEKTYLPKLNVVYVNKTKINLEKQVSPSIISTESPNVPKKSKNGTKMSQNSTEQTSICQNCTKNEVCLQNEGQLYPKCFKILDFLDPTGCGGLCAFGTQFCRLLDPKFQIRACLNIPGANFDCGSNFFKCLGTKMCIPNKKRCDGIIDCFDRSDEQKCDCNLKTSFRCGENLSCLPKKQRCDGSVDCWDASDELSCPVTKCPENEFPCRNGGCIPKEKICDENFDCSDKSDEPLGCIKNNNTLFKN